MSERNNLIWRAIQVICWIIFIGFCIQTGALLFNFIYSLFKPALTHNLYPGLDLSELHVKSTSIYSLILMLTIAVSTFKAYLFYITIRLLKEINLAKPFSETVSSIISKITYNAFSIGIISIIAQEFALKLLNKGYNLGSVEKFWNDGSTYLMMSAILFVIALIFKKGIELQNENDLTV